MLSWFDAKQAKGFGETLARFMIERLPKERTGSEKAFLQKTEKVLVQATLQVTKFRQANKLNAYKKAQLGNAFKWTLRDAGYANDQSDELTNWLMIQLR